MEDKDVIGPDAHDDDDDADMNAGEVCDPKYIPINNERNRQTHHNIKETHRC
jgi:hypothetical protein